MSIPTQKVLDLTTLGVRPESLRNTTQVSLPSDRVISVKQSADGAFTLSIVNIASRTVKNMQIPDAAAICHPDRPLAAMQLGSTIQIADYESNQPLVNVSDFADNIAFWRFVTPDMIIAVGQAQADGAAVYLWPWEKAPAPTPVFKLDPRMNGFMILDVQMEPGRKYITVSAIGQENGAVIGLTFLYTVAERAGRCLRASAATFHQMDAALIMAFYDEDERVVRLLDLNRTAYGVKSVACPPAQGEIVTCATGFGRDVLVLGCRGGAVVVIDLESAQILGTTTLGPVIKATRAEKGVLLLDANGALTVVSPPAGMALARFDAALASNDFAAAAHIAASNPAIRTQETLNRLSLLPKMADGRPPAMLYLVHLTQTGKLNREESVAFVQILQQMQMIDKVPAMMDKLTLSTALGDVLVPVPSLAQQALLCYVEDKNHSRVVSWMASNGKHAQIPDYCAKSGYSADFSAILANLLATNPAAAQDFAQALVSTVPQPLIPVNTVVEQFCARELYREAITILLKVIQDRQYAPETAPFQTQLLLVALRHNKQVAETILARGDFKHYDRAAVARACQQHGLWTCALSLCTSWEDVQAALKGMPAGTVEMNPETTTTWLVQTAPATIPELATAEGILSVLEVLATHAPAAAVRAATVLVTQQRVSLDDAVELFGKTDGISIAKLPEEQRRALLQLISPLLHHVNSAATAKVFIEVALSLDAAADVERAVRECARVYDARQIFDVLSDAPMSQRQPLALVTCADLNGLVPQLMDYFLRREMLAQITQYVQSFNTSRAAEVVDHLLTKADQVDRTYITRLLESIQETANVTELCEVCERHNCLRVLRPMLEARAANNKIDRASSTALIKARIDAHETTNMEQVLRKADYDHLAVGKFCESRDPRLAFIAYGTAADGSTAACRRALLRLTEESALYKQAARYLMSLEDSEVWELALLAPTADAEGDEDESRRSPLSAEGRHALIQQVKTVALPEATSKNQVTTCIRVFTQMSMRDETALADLLEVLDKIIFTNPAFGDSGDLQNMLLVTAIRYGDESRVESYISRLSAYTADKTAALAADAGMWRSAVRIYETAGMHIPALDVLFALREREDMADQWFTLATDYCGRCGDVNAFPHLVDAILELNVADITTVRQLYVCTERCHDLKQWKRIVATYSRLSTEDRDVVARDTVAFLELARREGVRAAEADTLLLKIYVQHDPEYNEQVSALLDNPDPAHSKADLSAVAAWCRAHDRIDRAIDLLTRAGDFELLAEVYADVARWDDSLAAARRADSLKCWRYLFERSLNAEMISHCIECAVHVILKDPDNLDKVISDLVARNHRTECVTILEKAVHRATESEQLSGALFVLRTALAEAYIYFAPEKLMGLLRECARDNLLNTARILQSCRRAHLWVEVAYLAEVSGDHEECCSVMLEWPAACFSHTVLIASLKKVASVSIWYKAVEIYLDLALDLLPELLKAILAAAAHPSDSVVKAPVGSGLAGQDKVIPVEHHYVLGAIQRRGVAVLAYCEEYVRTLATRGSTAGMLAAAELALDLRDVTALRTALCLAGGEAAEKVSGKVNRRRHRSGLNPKETAMLAQLRGHDLLPFRRVAIDLAMAGGDAEGAIKIGLSNGLYADVIAAAARSRNPQLARLVLQELAAVNPGLVPAVLARCGHLLPPHAALETAWMAGTPTEFLMPFMFESLRRAVPQSQYEVDHVEAASEEEESEDEADATGLGEMTRYSLVLARDASATVVAAADNIFTRPEGDDGVFTKAFAF